MNKLLLRQINKYLGSTKIPKKFQTLLQVISESYGHYEKDRELLERSIDISSREMIELNNQLRSEMEADAKRLEELKKTNSELDRFVYSVSHDLRAPLSSMMGIVMLIESEATNNNIAREIGLLKNSINKLDGFISDILDYSKNSRLEVSPEEIDFGTILNDIKSNLKYMASANNNVDVKVNINNKIPFYADKTRLNIIFNNLISNAIRYSNPEISNSFVQVNIDTSQENVTICVSDNGIGIAKENHDKIFNMFYRVSKKSVGSGLGLYIVKEAVEKLQGQIQMESDLKKGTKFIITIPQTLPINNSLIQT